MAAAPRVGVLGLGLIGGSLLLRLSAADPEVVTSAIGWDADAATRALATADGLTVAGGFAGLVGSCDVLVLAVPLPALPGVLDEVAAAAGSPLLTDVTSVKAAVVTMAAERGLPIVAGHPMAGSEESGFVAASADLLDAARWVLCVEDGTALTDWLVVARLVTGLGCAVVPTTAERHDAAVARVSQLPHLLASALAEQADDPLRRVLTAGSFRDGTRVAATREELTAAMCSGNAEQVRTALDSTLERLAQVRRLLVDGGDLRPWFAAGRQAYEDAHRPHVLPVHHLSTAGDMADVRTGLRSIGARGGHVVEVHDDAVTWAP